MNRRLGLLVVGFSLSSVAAAPPPAPAEAPKVQMQPRLALPQLAITHLQVTPGIAGALDVTVNNPTNSSAAMELHYKSQTIPFQAKPKENSVVTAKEPGLGSVCTLGSLAFNITGPNADLRVHHFEANANAAFTVGGVAPGSVGTPGDATGKVALVSGGALHWYGCGQPFSVSAAVFNDTTIAPLGLQAELYDTDNQKLGETPAIVPAGQKTVLTLEAATAAKLCGKEGNVRIHLVDPKSELGSKLLARDLLLPIKRTGTVSFKLVD